MKEQNKYGLLWAAVWALACLAAFLRRGLYINAVDAKGLLLWFHPLELLLWAVVALGASLIILTVRKLDGSNVYEENFGKSAPVGYVLLAWVIGLMVLHNDFSGPAQVARLLRYVGMACVPALIWGAVSRVLGKKPFFLVHVVLTAFLLLHLVSRYQDWSGNPQLQDYVFDLLAMVALILFGYQSAAFEADMGNRRLQLGMGLLAVLLCGAALGRTEMTGLYAAGMVWAATDLCRLTPPAKKEVEPDDPA